MISIIVPVLNEGAGLAAFLAKLQPLRAAGTEIVLVDGGSTDDTIAEAAGRVERILSAPRGRSRQMNAGAAAAKGDILLFLHADTELPLNACDAIRRALSKRAWGRFDIRIEPAGMALRLISRLMNLRSRLTGIATGDQALFVQRVAFEKVGGFPDIALMEDVAISKLLKRECRPECLSQQVITSGRRWERGGLLATVLLMWRLRIKFFLGVDADRLAVEYGYQPYRL
ncbi:MAG: TIGR04283 family arsenosugar biosynthesis glycosyltransferase [Rhizobiales bacterium]|nr:TIGR04283 family arsenosugar biosynthesis glycosyltransferase [Hyphomicrobiales bacterium]